MEQERDIPLWEKHGQTILTALILAGIFWVFRGVDEQSKNYLVITGKLETMTVKFDSLEKTVKNAGVNRYTSIDAENEERVRDAQHAAINARFDRNEKRIDLLERQR